ncbi:MAG: UbiA family prenyltransferase [Schaedlerella sp.]|nr:UbiA family prenyltransferase [Schaedlerella sp.]
MLSNVMKYFRVREWYDSKIPMMLSVFMYFYFLDPKQYGVEQFLYRFFSYFLYLAAFLAFSYLINDYSDMDIDRKAGKKKVILHVPKWMVVASMTGLILVGNLPLLVLVDWNTICILLSIVIYFLGAAYSVKGLRFKEKGAIGLVECSIAQKCVPVLLVPFLVEVETVLFVIWMVLLFVDGMRYIIIHQVIDLENDLKTGVKTYISSGKSLYKNAMFAEIFLELVLICLLFSKIVLEHWILWLFIICYLVNEAIIGTVICVYLKKKWLFTYEAVPMEDLFNVYMPILLLVGIAVSYPIVWSVVPVAMIYLYGGFKSKMVFINIFVKAKLHISQKEGQDGNHL